MPDDSDERQPLLNGHHEDSKSKLGPLDISRRTRRGILAGVWTATFLSALNTSLVATLLSSISSEYQRANQASWLGTAYLLATCTFTPLYGRLSNVLGRRGAMLLALTFASTGTLACALSPNMNFLIAARFLGGVGGGGLFTMSGIIITDMYSMRERGLAQGQAAVVNGMGLGLGGPLGGLIADRLGWRYAFFLQVPFFAMSFFLVSLFLRYETPGRGKSHSEVLKRIDFMGVFTLLAFVGSYLFFLSLKFNSEYPWNNPLVILTLTSTIVSLLVFILVELFVATEPILAPFLLKHRIAVLVSISNLLVAICNFTVTYFFPLYFEVVELTSASVAGAHIAPNSFSMSLGSLFAGWIMHRTGKYKVLNVVFGILPTVAAVSISRLREDSSIVTKWLAIIPLGFGNAVVLQTTLIALLASVSKPSMPVAMGFGQLFRGVGQVSGVALSAAIFQTILGSQLHKRISGPGAEELICNIKHSSALVKTLPPDIQRAARDSYAVALRVVFTVAACCTFTAFVVRLGIPELPLDEDSESDSDQEPSQSGNIASDEASESEIAPVRPHAPKGRRLSTYQNAPLDPEQGNSARHLDSRTHHHHNPHNP